MTADSSVTGAKLAKLTAVVKQLGGAARITTVGRHVQHESQRR